ncbi:MAG: alpha/beta hydrolase [Candidatus Omnitrophota bacterium]
MLEIKLIQRGFQENLVLIPGWAADYRIFDSLDLSYNYLAPVKFSPLNFAAELDTRLDEYAVEKVSLLGWSMGGFLACDFAAASPERVDELILLSVREKFEQGYLQEIAEKIRKNKRAWLHKFYLGCFSKSDFEGRSYFKKELLKDYVDGISLGELVNGLGYLSKAKIDTGALTRIKKIRIFHGESDAVAPVEEAGKISSCLPQAEFISLPNLGHIIFLNKRFKAAFYG